MKFRRLTLDELKELHEEFIQFLASNTITGEEWKHLKENNYEKAETLIEIFSDIVIEKSLSNIRFLEKREPKNLLLFHCKENEVDLIGLSLPEDSKVDLTNNEHIASVASEDMQTDLKIFRSSKMYQNNREEEVFKLLNEGCLITDEKLYSALITLE